MFDMLHESSFEPWALLFYVILIVSLDFGTGGWFTGGIWSYGCILVLFSGLSNLASVGRILIDSGKE
jgi:hypothetical protein